MVQPTVQLDDGGAERHVAVDDAGDPRLPPLPLGPGQAVGALHPGQVAVLEHRAGPLGDVAQHVLRPAASGVPRALGQGGDQLRGGRAPGARRPRQHRDPVQLRAGRGGRVEHRVGVPLAGRAEVPQHGLVEAGHLVHDHPVERGRSGAAAVDRHVDGRTTPVGPPRDGTVVRAERGAAVQGGGPGREHRSPGVLGPGGPAGVVDVDAGQQGGPGTAPQHPPDVRLAETGLEGLAARHDAVLPLEQGAYDGGRLVHAAQPAPGGVRGARPVPPTCGRPRRPP
ncbi:hypothetical protein GCM10009562_33360 [Nocardioides aquaticus]